jgi:hypothetical protein
MVWEDDNGSRKARQARHDVLYSWAPVRVKLSINHGGFLRCRTQERTHHVHSAVMYTKAKRKDVDAKDALICLVDGEDVYVCEVCAYMSGEDIVEKKRMQITSIARIVIMRKRDKGCDIW